MFDRHPILTRFSLFVLLPCLLLGLLAYQSLYKSVPLYTGQKELKGILKSVDILFDAQGTPTVLASNDYDAYFAQGYLHASERIWQMEVQRRTVQGRLSEIVGISALPTDLWMRTLDIQGSAAKAWDYISPRAQEALMAYANGVNAWLDANSELPPEFSILNVEPESWTVVDSLAWQKVLALNLGLNMYGEMHRLSVLKVLPPEHLQVFFEHDPAITSMDSLPSDMSFDATAATELEIAQSGGGRSDYSKGKYRDTLLYKNWDALATDLRSNLALGELYSGSNGWAVSGKHTETGFPILANDPHLGVQQNAVWYAIQMRGDDLDVSGMSIVGIPGIALGRNKHISWGTTSLMSDQQDLFFLEVPLGSNTTYLTDGELQPIEVMTETINIRSEIPEAFNKKIKPIEIEIRKTDIGPIVSDAVSAPRHTVALRWSALDDDDRSFEAFYQLQYATDWQSFRNAVSLLKAPGLHFVYADTDGNIGSQVGGHLPVRGTGVGVIPVSGSKPENLWQGYVPFESLPYIYNPDSGIVVSANNKIPTTDQVVISHDWASMARNLRIHELLEEHIDAGKPLTIGDMRFIQNDFVDLNARFFLPYFLRNTLREKIVAMAKSDEKEIVENAFAALSNWDAAYTPDSVAASIYQYWIRILRQKLFAGKLNPMWNSSQVSNDVMENVSAKKLSEILTQSESFWCESTDEMELPCQTALINSFYQAIEELQDDTGSNNASEWHWGKLHHLELTHRVFSSNPLTASIFTHSHAMGGSINTINIAIWQKKPEGDYRKSLGASFRHIFDMLPEGSSEVGKNAYILPSGQSAHFLSKHYADQTEPYVEGNTHYYASFPRGPSTQQAQNETLKNHAQIQLIPAGAQ